MLNAARLHVWRFRQGTLVVSTMQTPPTRPLKRGWPVFIAFAIAPPIAAGMVAVCMFLVVLLMAPTAAPTGMGHTILTFLLAWAGMSVIASAAQWTLGFGWHALAIRRNWRRAIDYVIAGAVLGGALGIASALAPLVTTGVWGFSRPQLVLLVLIVQGTISIAVMSGSMWLTWLMRRPDRDIAPEDAGAFD